MIVASGGGVGSMYAVQIESLEQFQQKLTSILQSLEADNTVMSMSDQSSTFGSFPEAQGFSTAYAQTKQDLINTFNEVTQLVNTMISVAGANASKYKQTEQDIAAKFNAILQKYGDTPAAGTGNTTGRTTTGTTMYSAQPQPGSSTTSTTTTTGTTAGTTTITPSAPSAPNTTTTTTSGSGNTSSGAA
jgi:hypothetical protein